MDLIYDLSIYFHSLVKLFNKAKFNSAALCCCTFCTVFNTTGNSVLSSDYVLRTAQYVNVTEHFLILFFVGEILNSTLNKKFQGKKYTLPQKVTAF